MIMHPTSDILARMAHVAPHCLPLVAAVQAGKVEACFLHRASKFPRQRLEKARKPVVLVIGDDDHENTGPNGFPFAVAACRWADRKAIILHAAGGAPEHYAFAVEGALACGRCLLIETGTDHAEIWAAAMTRYAPNARKLAVLTRHRAAHPIIPRGVIQ